MELWDAHARLKGEDFCPVFLKTGVRHLPGHFTIRTELE